MLNGIQSSANTKNSFWYLKFVQNFHPIIRPLRKKFGTKYPALDTNFEFSTKMGRCNQHFNILKKLPQLFLAEHLHND